MAELYFGNIIRLRFVYAEAYHKVWNNFRFFLGFTDDLYSLVNIKKYFFQTFEQVEFALFL